MLSFIGRWIVALSAIGLVACGKKDSVVGAMDANEGGSGNQSGSEEGGRGNGVGGTGPAGGTGGGSGLAGSGGNGSVRGGSEGNGATGGAGLGGDATGGVAGERACEEGLEVQRRLVRLTFTQMTSSLAALLGEGAAERARVALASELLGDQAFPPLSAAGEGMIVNDPVFASTDELAQLAGKYVLDHFDEVTGCGAAPSLTCVQTFIADFTERAYRRPPSDVELANIVQVFTEAQALQVTTQEAIAAAVSAVFDSPIFAYRTEFGAAARADGRFPLLPFEMASQLSFFLTNSPPDTKLLAAAKADALGTAAALAPHVDRLLADPLSRANLETSFSNYLGLPWLQTVAIDDPDFDAALRGSMQAETRAFLSRQLWGAPLDELLTSRSTRVNASLAALYGVPFPPAGGEVDGQGFADVELPAVRSGLLTQAALLAARSLPKRPSIAARGLWVNDTLGCFATSPPSAPDGVDENVGGALGERESVAFRTQTTPCSGCHLTIDSIGLTLGHFDAIGRFRSVDSDGLRVDTVAELPGGVGTVDGVAGLVEKIVEDDRLARCLARSYLRYAFADGQTQVSFNDCAVQKVVAAFKSGDDLAFSGILRQIALSDVLAARKP